MANFSFDDLGKKLSKEWAIKIALFSVVIILLVALYYISSSCKDQVEKSMKYSFWSSLVIGVVLVVLSHGNW